MRQVLDDPRLHVLVIGVVCGVLYFPFLAARDFWALESQYAEVIRVMLLDHDYLVPRVNGVFFTESPPLYFWLAALFSWMVGGVGEWPIRLPSALSATELVLVSYYFVRKRFGARLAIISAVVLATSVLTVHVTRHVQVNMLFYLCITIATFLLMELLVFDSQRPLHAYGAWLFMALACLTNGPIGFLFPALVAGTYLTLCRSGKKFFSLRPISGSFLFLAVTAPWLVYLAWNGENNWSEAILAHVRLSGFGSSDHQIYFRFPLALAPWCFLFIPAGMCLWRERSKLWDGPVLFFFLWFVLGLSIAELSFGRHSHLLFLAHVPLAVGLGIYLDRLDTTDLRDPVWVWTGYCVKFFCLLFLVNGIFGPIVVAYRLPFLAFSAIVLGLTLAVLSAVVLHALSRRAAFALITGLVAFPVAANLVLQALVFPDLNALMIRPFAEKVGAIIRANPQSQVAIFSRRLFNNFNYYSKIHKFEVIRRPAAAAEFLRSQGSHFLLINESFLPDVEKAAGSRLTEIIAATTTERWLLLYSCNGTCESTPALAESKRPRFGD